MDEKRVMDVLLHDTCSLSVLGGVDYDVLNFSKVLGNLDASTLICVLTWLDDPDVGLLLSFSFFFLQFKLEVVVELLEPSEFWVI